MLQLLASWKCSISLVQSYEEYDSRVWSSRIGLLISRVAGVLQPLSLKMPGQIHVMG